MHYTKGDNSSTQSQSDIDFERCTCIYSDNGPAQQTWFCLINYSSKLIYIKLYTNTPRALPCTLCTTDFLLQYILNHSFHPHHELLPLSSIPITWFCSDINNHIGHIEYVRDWCYIRFEQKWDHRINDTKIHTAKHTTF